MSGAGAIRLVMNRVWSMTFQMPSTWHMLTALYLLEGGIPCLIFSPANSIIRNVNELPLVESSLPKKI